MNRTRSCDRHRRLSIPTIMRMDRILCGFWKTPNDNSINQSLKKKITFWFLDLFEKKYFHVWGAVLIFFRYTLISKNKCLIIRIMISKNNSWCQKKILISKNLFCYIRKSFFYRTNSNSRYQKKISWYHIMDLFLYKELKFIFLY